MTPPNYYGRQFTLDIDTRIILNQMYYRRRLIEPNQTQKPTGPDRP